jgi:hypothetical protein
VCTALHRRWLWGSEVSPRHGTNVEEARDMLPFVILAAQVLPPNEARGPAVRPREAASVDLSVRAVAGVGGGNIGPAGRAGLESDYWLSRHVGLGILGGVAIQDRIFDRSSELTFVAPALSYRSAPAGSWWLFGLSAGYAHRSDEIRSFCLWQTSCRGGSTLRRDGAYFGATAGYLGHAGPVEVGPLLRLDGAVTELGASTLVTLNLALGLAPR